MLHKLTSLSESCSRKSSGTLKRFAPFWRITDTNIGRKRYAKKFGKKSGKKLGKKSISALKVWARLLPARSIAIFRRQCMASFSLRTTWASSSPPCPTNFTLHSAITWLEYFEKGCFVWKCHQSSCEALLLHSLITEFISVLDAEALMYNIWNKWPSYICSAYLLHLSAYSASITHSAFNRSLGMSCAACSVGQNHATACSGIAVDQQPSVICIRACRR